MCIQATRDGRPRLPREKISAADAPLSGGGSTSSAGRRRSRCTPRPMSIAATFPATSAPAARPALHRIPPRSRVCAGSAAARAPRRAGPARARGWAGAGRVHVEQRVRRVNNRDALLIHQPEIQRVSSVRRQWVFWETGTPERGSAREGEEGIRT